MVFHHLVIFDHLNWRRAAYLASLAPIAQEGIRMTEAKTLRDVANAGPDTLCLFVAGSSRIYEGDTYDLIDEIGACFEGIVAVISDCIRPEDIAHALQHELAGILSSGEPLEVSLAALRFLLAGGRYIPHTVVQSPGAFDMSYLPRRAEPVETYNMSDCADPLQEHLTARQKEVLLQLADGLSNKQIARDLSLSEATVKSHVREIMRKLDVSNRTQAALLAGQFQARIPTSLHSAK